MKCKCWAMLRMVIILRNPNLSDSVSVQSHVSCYSIPRMEYDLVISLLWTVPSTGSFALGTLLPLSGKKLDCKCWKIRVTCEVRLELGEDIEW